MSDNTPGWQSDPTGQHDHRYWDGSQWTDNVSDAGIAGTDAYEPAASADPGDGGEVGDATVADSPGWAAAGAPVPPEPVDPTAIGDAPPAGDPTAAWPTAPAAPGAPAPPPPYVATNPVSSGGGGSKKGLLVGGGILAAVAAAVVLFLALGKDDDKSSVRAELAAKMQDENPGVTSDQADCVADLLVDEAGEDAFKDVDLNDADPPQAYLDAFLAVGIDRLVEDCNLDESIFGGTTDTTDGSGEEGSYGSDPELDALYDDCEGGDYAACDDLSFQSPAGSEYEDFGDSCGDRNEPAGTCVEIYGVSGGDSGGFSDGLTDSTDLPADFKDTLADTYEQSLGISRDKAECLADKLGTAIEDGTLDQADAVSGFMDYLSDCDISLEEIGAN